MKLKLKFSWYSDAMIQRLNMLFGLFWLLRLFSAREKANHFLKRQSGLEIGAERIARIDFGFRFWFLGFTHLTRLGLCKSEALSRTVLVGRCKLNVRTLWNSKFESDVVIRTLLKTLWIKRLEFRGQTLWFSFGAKRRVNSLANFVFSY